jgi:signal transduction histidine kinase/FixJ family two-component response regulator
MVDPRILATTPLAGESGKPQILIVDDDPDAREVLSEMVRLSIRGAAVDVCASARTALARVRATDYAAIISDIRMPEMDGMRLLDAVRDIRPETPVLLMTAYGDDMAIRALRAGAYDFIEKPVNSDYLAASLKRALQVGRLNRQVAAQTAALAHHATELEAMVQERTRELVAANQAKNEFLAARDRALAEAEAAQRRLAFLAEASRVLAGSLDYATTLDQVARLTVPYLADYCVFDIIGADGSLAPVALVHVDPAQEPLLRAQRVHHQPVANGAHPLARVLTTGRAEYYPELADALLGAAATDDDELAIFRALEPQSCMVVPLVARDHILGLVILVASVSGRHYGPEDLALAEDLAGRAAQAVDNARLYREAQEALQARDQFLSVAAHELRTPITAMLASVQLLQRRASHDEAASERDRRAMNILGEQTRRLHRLVLSLLDLSRLQTGQFTLDRQAVDVIALARRVVEELDAMLPDHALSFVGPDTSLVVDGDDLLLEQVLQNLLQNAIKYSPVGRPITVSCEQRAATVYLRVIDQGMGIPAEALPRLFSRFYRANNVDSRQVSGMGLGLYVVKEIVALHGGTVDVASTVGQGSTFSVCLPLVLSRDA